MGADGMFGFRRVEQVRVSIEGTHPRAVVLGTLHRCPHAVRVPLSVAARLVAAGAPLQLSPSLSPVEP